MIRVLVADDSPTNRALLASILSTDAELQVVGEAQNGDEAVTLTQRLRPHVITMDIHMPGMNGRELLLRARALGAKFPIILRSGSISFLSHEVRTLFSRCVDKAESICTLLGIISTFLDPNEIPDFGSYQIRSRSRNPQGT